jgi:hypothetical protein
MKIKENFNSSFMIPIQYHSIFTKISKSINCGLIISYIISQEDKCCLEDSTLIDKIGLTKNQVVLAKKKLKKFSFVHISLEGIPRKTHYKIIKSELNKTIEEYYNE